MSFRPSSPAAPAHAATSWLSRHRGFAVVIVAWTMLAIAPSIFSGDEVLRALGVLLALPALFIVWRSGQQQRRLQHEEQARWRELLAVDEVVVGIDTDFRITLLSDLGQRLLGLTEHAALGADWVDLTSDDADAAEARKNLRTLLESTIIAPEFVEFEAPIRTNEGRRLFRWRATVAIRDGKAVGALASGIDITVQRQAQQQLMRDQDDLTQLVALARAVARETDARQAVVDGTAPLAEADIATLTERTPDGERLVVTASTDAELAGVEFSLEPGAPSGVGFAFASGKPLFIAETEGHPLINQELVAQTGLHSVLYEPVYVAGEVVGVLSVGWNASNVVLGSHRTNVVSLAAGEAAVAVERSSSIQALQHAALADPLTGVPNRRAFDDQLASALAVARRDGTPLAIAMMDLNGFKQLNDTEGHDAGDRVLKETASLWVAELRPGDLLARFGGDEFAVILPTCGEDAAGSVAQRLRDAVRHPAGSGVGFAVWNGTETGEELLKRADRALYTDKAQRSRTISDPSRVAAVFESGFFDDTDDPELQSLTETLAATLGVPVAALALITDQHAVYTVETGFDGELAETRRLELGQSYCQYPAATGRELVVGDTSADPMLRDNFSTTDLGLRAYAGVPLKLDDITVGVLCCASDEPKEWTPEQLGALRMAADHATRRLERQRSDHAR